MDLLMMMLEKKSKEKQKNKDSKNKGCDIKNRTETKTKNWLYDRGSRVLEVGQKEEVRVIPPLVQTQ